MRQDHIQRSPTATCANGHPCNQYVTTCRICGTPVTNKPYQSPQQADSAYQAPPPGFAYRPAVSVYRGPPPSVWPTVLVTFFFGIFGVIPAAIHTSNAREAGRPTNTYWAAFGWTMVTSILLWFLLILVIATSLHTTY